MTSLRNFLINLLALLVLVSGAIALYDRGTPGRPAAGSVMRPLPPPFEGVTRLRLMLIGADERKDDPGRSDTLMVLQINPSTGRAALLSIPRDVRVRIPDTPEGEKWRDERRIERDKINHAYRFGGVELSRQVVEELVGWTLDGYVKVNLQGFVKAVDTLGGVDLEVEDAEGKGRGMNYDCPQDGLVIHLKPGRQHLTGYKAMGYVRYRKSNIPGAGCSDYQRADRQQKFLKAMIAQKVKFTQLPALMKAGQQVFACIKTTLSWRECFDLLRFMKDMPPPGVKSLTLPVIDEHHGVYYSELDTDKYAAMRDEIESFLDGAGGSTGKPVTVEVLNGSGVPGAAARAAESLKTAGFRIGRVGNAADRKHETTAVLYRGEYAAPAAQAAALLGASQVAQDPSGPAPEGGAQVQVTIGKDFRRSGN